MRKSVKVTFFIILLLVIDQISKILVKTNMYLFQDIHIFDWFYINFIENPGMAFGITLGSKTFLTLFRIIVSGFILYYIIQLIRQNWKTGYIITISLIFTGAIGNIFDSLFYGLIFSESTSYNIASFVGFGNGYSSFLHGKVVDMLYFPLFTFPDWVPFWGGDIFFSPIFNFADSCITVGVFILLIFFRNDFNTSFDAIFNKKNHNKEINNISSK